MKNILFIFTAVCLVSCFSTDPHEYNSNSNLDTEITNNKTTINEEDTKYITVAELPISYRSTDYLVFPISIQTIVKSKKTSRFENLSSNSNSWSENDANYYSGQITNIYFQHKITGEINKLSDKNILINQYQYLSSLYKASKIKFFILEIIDEDSNDDKKLDYYDNASIYLCKPNGKGLIKISPKGEKIIDWKVLDKIGKLFFRTIEDINGDKNFDNTDKYNIYQVDLSSEIQATKLFE